MFIDVDGLSTFNSFMRFRRPCDGVSVLPMANIPVPRCGRGWYFRSETGQKVRNQAGFHVGFRIIALLRCLIRERLSAHSGIRGACAANSLRRGFHSFLNPRDTPGIAPGSSTSCTFLIKRCPVCASDIHNDRMAERVTTLRRGPSS